MGLSWEFSAVPALLYMVLTIILLGITWRNRHFFGMGTWLILFKLTRGVRAHGTAISTIGTLSIVLVAYLYGDLSGIVIVTLFYATALFFTNFLQAKRPYPVVAFENRYYGDGYGKNGENGFQYEFGLRNNGTTKLIDPTVEYRLYNSDFQPVSGSLLNGWIEHNETDREDLMLSPGEHKRFEIEHSPIKHDGKTDYYLFVKVTPRVQYSEVTLLFMREIVADD